MRRPSGLSKEGLRAMGGEEEGSRGENWRIQFNFFIVCTPCVSM